MCDKERLDTAEEHVGCGERLDDILKILATHSRILEKHADTIENVGVTLKRIRADIAIIKDAQKAQNQLVASIHQLWSRLQCVAPPPEDEKGPKPNLDQDASDFRRRSASNEIRQLGLILVNPDDDGD